MTITNYVTRITNGLISYNFPVAGLEDVFSSQYVPHCNEFQGINGGLVYARCNSYGVDNYISIGFMDYLGVVKCEYNTSANNITPQIKGTKQSTCIVKLSRDGNKIYLHSTAAHSLYNTYITKYTLDRTNWTITYDGVTQLTYQAGAALYNSNTLLANDNSTYFAKGGSTSGSGFISKINAALTTNTTISPNTGGALCSNNNQRIYSFSSSTYFDYGTQKQETIDYMVRIVDDVLFTRETARSQNNVGTVNEKILKAVITPDNHIVGMFYNESTGVCKLYWIEEAAVTSSLELADFNVIDLSTENIDGITGRLYFNQLSCDGLNNLYLTQKNGGEKGVFKISSPFTSPVYTKIALTGDRIRQYLDNCHHDPFGYDLSKFGFTGSI